VFSDVAVRGVLVRSNAGSDLPRKVCATVVYSVIDMFMSVAVAVIMILSACGKGGNLCPHGPTGVVLRRGPTIISHTGTQSGRRVRDRHIQS